MSADIQGLAVLHYGAADFDIVRPGQFVLCAVTGARIDLEDLRYWSADLQQAYRGAAEATKALTDRSATRG